MTDTCPSLQAFNPIYRIWGAYSLQVYTWKLHIRGAPDNLILFNASIKKNSQIKHEL